MSEVDSFIAKFSGLTEEYKFYDGQVTLQYDPKDHVYLLLMPDGTLEKQAGVTSVCHILDKSNVLIPWACKMMAQKLQTYTDSIFGTSEAATFAKKDLEEWIKKAKSAHRDKLEDAGAVGHTAHAWIEKYIQWAMDETHVLDLMPFDERAKNACLAALDWMEKHNVRWIGTERKIYSRKHKYAGTMDGLCLADSCDNPNCCRHVFKDRLTLGDWKTSNYLYVEFILQTAAYKQAYEEETGQHVEDVWIIRLGKDDAAFDAWHVDLPTAEHGWDAFLKALDLSRAMVLVEDDVVLMKDYRKDKIRAAKAVKKAENLKVKCKGADKYKGTRAPKCNKGNPCESCVKKYAEAQEAKAQKLKDLPVKKTKIKEPVKLDANILKSLQKLLDKPVVV
jgi:hypothetical protein